MALMTGQQYKDSIKDMKINVYCFGKKIENQLEHPITRPAIDAVALAYDMAHDPDYQDKITTTSHLTGERINYFTHLYRSPEDFAKRLNLMRDLLHYHGMCTGARCVSGNIANGLESVTYEMDKKYGTGYLERFRKYWAKVQSEDLSVGGYITDPKGDRSKRPADQADPDSYMHVVEEKKEGIVVRGAKVLISGASIAHEALIMPTRAMRRTKRNMRWLLPFPRIRRVSPCCISFPVPTSVATSPGPREPTSVMSGMGYTMPALFSSMMCWFPGIGFSCAENTSLPLPSSPGCHPVFAASLPHANADIETS